MSEIPPGSDPPPQYVAYPRNTVLYGSAEKLQALADGYFGLNKVFLLNVLLAIATRFLPALASDPAVAVIVFLGLVAVVGLIVGFCTFPYNKKIGFGKNWNPGNAILASTLMGLNSALCCGIIGYVVMQQIAASEMKKYGVKVAAFGGAKKKDIEMIVAQMQATQQSQNLSPMPPP